MGWQGARPSPCPQAASREQSDALAPCGELASRGGQVSRQRKALERPGTGIAGEEDLGTVRQFWLVCERVFLPSVPLSPSAPWCRLPSEWLCLWRCEGTGW